MLPNIKAVFHLSGPFAGIILILIVLTAYVLYMVSITNPPVKHVYVGLSVVIVLVALYIVISTTRGYKIDHEIVPQLQQEPTEEVTNKIKQAQEHDSMQMEDKE